MKKILVLLLAALTLTACSASNDEYYQHAQRLLGAGEYAEAARLFDQLGGYDQSSEYALYAAGLHALSQGDLSLARQTLLQVDPFQNSSRFLTYVEAAELAETGELEKAAMLYDSLGAFADSIQQAQAARSGVPDRDKSRARALMASGGYHQAMDLLENYPDDEEAEALLRECEAALVQKAYDQADDLYTQGRYEEALAAFLGLGDTLDAAARAMSCRSEMYLEAEDAYAQVTFATCEALMNRYVNLDGYLDSARKLAALQERFGAALRLKDRIAALPYVQWGSYPAEETGAEQPLLWRALGVHGDTVTLLCESVIDAMPAKEATELRLGSITAALPDTEQLSRLEELRCTATPYAIAQGVRHHSDGSAWWWLADEVLPGRQSVVWYNGSILTRGVDAGESAVGVRPLVYLDLNDCAFTQGSGTRNDPFR